METPDEIVSDSSGSDANPGPLNALIDALPFELHVPGYHYLGAGTKLTERLERGDAPINPLDEAARLHDIAYSEKKTDRRQVDQKLAERAFSRVLDEDASSEERTFALLTGCCMLCKINFDKLFSRITKAIGGKRRRGRKKKKVQREAEKK